MREDDGMMWMARMNRLGVLMMLAVMLTAGCAPMLPFTGRSTTPPDLYDLTPVLTAPLAGDAVSWALVIQEPIGARSLDTDRIAVRPSAHELRFISGSRWSARAPRMIQDILIESFENSGRIVAVSAEWTGIRGDIVIKSALRDFEAVYDGGGRAPEARVRLTVKIVDPRTARIFATRDFSAAQRARADRTRDIVTAFDAALSSLLPEIISWILETGDDYLSQPGQRPRKSAQTSGRDYSSSPSALASIR
jgi:cholesterol transport system auxiliary component